jgi:UDP:flavonoid glycosyltransferase YjiC (YdhE family)
MKIGIIVAVSWSSRGDVEPYVALAKALQARGHQPRLVCEDKFEPFVRSHGVECVPVRGPQGPDPSARGLRAQRQMGQMVKKHVGHQLEAALAGCRDVDALMSSESMFSFNTGYNLAEKLEVPYLPAFVTPVGMTGAFPNPGFARFWPKSPALNRATFRLAERMVRHLTSAPLRRARRTVLGLPKKGGDFLAALYKGLPALYGYSPNLLPKPDDWPECAHVTGYWFLEPPPGSPPPGLEEFLLEGEPPVCLALGRGMEFGIRALGAGRFWAAILESLKRCGRRGVVITGGYPAPSGTELPDSVFLVDSVSHAWLFPRVSAVVHHAGAGTTGAVLRSGAPSVPVPAVFDQVFWAHQLARVGAGTRALPMRKLAADTLGRRLDLAVNDPGIAAQAKAISAGMARENGAGEAARLAESYFSEGLAGASAPRHTSEGLGWSPS